MKNKLKGFWEKQNSFENKIYWLILIAGNIVTFFSILQTVIQNMGIVSVIAPACCFVIFFAITIISIKVGVSEVLYLLLCMAMYFIVMPFNFFACGGMKSGIPCFFVTSVILPVFGLKGRKKYITFATGMLALILTMAISTVFPDMVAEITYRNMIIDNIFSFCVCGIALFLFSDKAVRTYTDERGRANKLQDDIGEMSTTDELTKLLNRRAFLNSFGSKRYKDAYILTFDIENIKGINDKYSQHVGDRILMQTAEILQDEITKKKGEIAARYGGDEFVAVIFALNEKEAKDRSNRITDRIKRMEVPGFGTLQVYPNASVVECDRYETAKEMIKAVDDALHPNR